MMSRLYLGSLTLLAIGAITTARGADPEKPPVKVFILAGQSNMQGHGHVRTLPWLGGHPQHGGLVKKVLKADGTPVVRDDVFVSYRRGDGPAKTGKLTTGFGVRDDQIGPELLFGTILGDHYENPVLLIKTAWGGRSLAVNFRPPGAGPLPIDKFPEAQRDRLKQSIADKKLVVGAEYRDMLKQVKEALANLDRDFPELKGRGHELAGFAWFQGWNDMIDRAFTAEYADNLAHFIKDVRRDLKAPNLPFVIGEMGVGGDKANANVLTFRKAQADAASRTEFKGNVALAKTAQYWDETAQAVLDEGWIKRKWTSKELQEKFEKMGSQPPYHYLGSARIYSLVGYGMAKAMVELGKK